MRFNIEDKTKEAILSFKDLPSPKHSDWDVVLESAQKRLTTLGLPTEYYIIYNFAGYSSLTQTPNTDVYCLEAQLGPTHNKPGFTTYAVAQTFHPKYPSVALVLIINRKDSDGAVDATRPVYNPRIDKAFSNIFLPFMHTAFNALDPTGQNRGLLVQSYNASITLTDIPQATIASLRILRRFKKDGQLAQIAADFDDPFTNLVALLMRPLIANQDVHYLPRTDEVSSTLIPLKSMTDSPYTVGENSMALDEGFKIAFRYFDAHYASHAG